ncbi:ABC transporter ATP-binding protein [Synechococcus sp. RS9916]|uniref:ABC transporter ATP-binding protein n=1 Tax=Synechococcus sp. RS9916 TaxID=221359 RepID=UPI0002FB32FE|nr:ABC transporter ATP-binding protein [Synechococcus sp. RS9916]
MPVSFIILKTLWLHIPYRIQKLLLFQLFLTILVGISEFLLLGSIYPFLQVLTSTSNEKSPLIISILSQLSVSLTDNNILLFSCIIFIFSIVFTTSAKLYNLHFGAFVASQVDSWLSKRLFDGFLTMTYLESTLTSSSNITTTIVQHVASVTSVVRAYILIITSFTSAIGILAALFFTEPFLSSSVLIILIICYILIGSRVKEILLSNGSIASQLTTDIYKHIQESYGALSDIIINSSQVMYSKKFDVLNQHKKNLQAQKLFLTSFPRFLLEGISLTVLIIVAFTSYLLVSTNVLSKIAVLALGLQRMLPSLQQIYGNWSNIKASSTPAFNVLTRLSDAEPKFLVQSQIKALPFNKSITLSNVSFAYPNSQKTTISNISLFIQKGEIVGFVGKSGQGKSTLINILMGLLIPTSGSIYIDSELISIPNDPNFNVSSRWMKNISHVSQNIFIFDSTLSSNISLEEDSSICLQNLRECATAACIDDFIMSLPDQYSSMVGQSGAKLSGGQKQRIGIARALYQNPSVLVLDEATSALDPDTESRIIRNIINFNKKMTIIMVSHRYGTLSNCDKIFSVDSTGVKEISYSSLTSPQLS